MIAMAKLGLLFVTVFCIVQLSLAARLPRETETTTQSILDSFKQSLDNISDDVGNTLKKTFTRENADNLAKTISNTASDFQKKTEDFFGDLKNKASEIVRDYSEKND